MPEGLLALCMVASLRKCDERTSGLRIQAPLAFRMSTLRIGLRVVLDSWFVVTDFTIE